MESLSSVSTIVRIAQEIAGAVSTVSRNRSRCRKLANRVQCIGDLLRELESTVGSPPSAADDDEATRRLLDGLEDTLHRALELVTSCQDSGCPRSLIAGGRMAGQFDEMDGEIDRCLLDLGVANRIQIARLERLLHQNAFHYGDPPAVSTDTVTLRIGMPCDDSDEHIIHTVQGVTDVAAAAACGNGKDQRRALKEKLNRNVELVKRPVSASNGGGVRNSGGKENYSKANNKGACEARYSSGDEIRKEKAVAMANMGVTNQQALALVPIGDVAARMYHPASPYSFLPYPQGSPGNAQPYRHRVPIPAKKYGGGGDTMVDAVKDADGDMGAGKKVRFTADSGGGDKKAAPIGGGEWKASAKKAAASNVMAIGVPVHELVPPPSYGYGYWPYAEGLATGESYCDSAGRGPSDAATATAYYPTFEHMFSDENPNACTIL